MSRLLYLYIVKMLFSTILIFNPLNDEFNLYDIS